MRYYFRENARRYEIMTRMGLEDWATRMYGGIDFHDFSSREFLEMALPKLRLKTPDPEVLELGTGVGPVALYLAERGYKVTGYDLIPEAIRKAREIAAVRGLAIAYEVVDVTAIPQNGRQFDLIVDSYCINHIVFSKERKSVFESLKAMLEPKGYYLVSSSVYESRRHSPDKRVVAGCASFPENLDLRMARRVYHNWYIGDGEQRQAATGSLLPYDDRA